MRSYRDDMTSDDYYGPTPELEPEPCMLPGVPVFRRLSEIPEACRMPGMEARPDEVELLMWPDSKTEGRCTAWCQSFARIHQLPHPFVGAISDDEYHEALMAYADAEDKTQAAMDAAREDAAQRRREEW